MKTAHNVKLLNGSKQEVSYTGVETVTMPGNDGQDKVFTAGAPIDAMDISPDFSGGDMPLGAPEGYVVRSATIKKPEGAEQVIAKGQTLAGISGVYVTPGTAKEIEPDFSGGDQTVAAEGDERWSEVTVKKPETLVPDNIEKGVEIAGVIGTNQGVRYGKVLRRLIGGNNALNISSYNAKYCSCGVTLMIPSGAEVVKVGFSKTMSYGASVSATKPDWEAGSYPFSSYISGQYLVITASFAFVPSRSQEKHRLRGGVEYFEPIAPLYIDTTENAALGGLHVPVLSGSTFAGYVPDDFETESPIEALMIDYYSLRASKTAFSGIHTITVKGESLPSGAFSYTYGPTRVMCPEVALVPKYAFYECKTLKEVQIPKCESIESYGFAYTGVKAVSFPNCKTIGSSAFYSCNSLESCYFLGQTVPTLENSGALYASMLRGTTPSGRIFVRESLVEAFKAATNWSAFSAAISGLTDAQIAELEGNDGILI